jgi:hypothetical protein
VRLPFVVSRGRAGAQQPPCQQLCAWSGIAMADWSAAARFLTPPLLPAPTTRSQTSPISAGRRDPVPALRPHRALCALRGAARRGQHQAVPHCQGAALHRLHRRPRKLPTPLALPSFAGLVHLAGTRPLLGSSTTKQAVALVCPLCCRCTAVTSPRCRAAASASSSSATSTLLAATPSWSRMQKC